MSWLEALTSHLAVTCGQCCGCCCGGSAGGDSKSGRPCSCWHDSCDWLLSCCDWILCCGDGGSSCPCTAGCCGWTRCPHDAVEASEDDVESSFRYGPDADSSSAERPTRRVATMVTSMVEPPYLELQGSTEDDIPFERVFEMEQKKRQLFGGRSSLAQVH